MRQDLAKFPHFGEILQYLAKYFKLLFNILKNLEPTFLNLLCYWANIHCCKWPKLSTPSGHTEFEMDRKKMSSK